MRKLLAGMPPTWIYEMETLVGLAQSAYFKNTSLVSKKNGCV
jgi:hypothetical protein